MAKRVESPSSINTFKQCNRKYYYQYIAKLPTLANIHQIRGNIAHSCLEDFYNIDVSAFLEQEMAFKFRTSMQKLLFHHWMIAKPRLNELKLSSDQERFYFEETMLMLTNWTEQFIGSVKGHMEQKKVSLGEAFVALTPLRELEFSSEKYEVRGFVDAIHHVGEEVHIIDYKTNNTFDFKDSIKLQLAIYSLLYEERYGKMPSKVGIFFLRHKLKLMDVDSELLELAKREIELIHTHTTKTEQVEHYSRTVSSLCKWSSGQCDFYGVCKPHEKEEVLNR